ncbi:MAG: M1 family aminopeptidase, partial [Acidimicrobiales bacterium]
TSPTCPATPARTEPAADRPRYKLTLALSLAENVVRGTTDVRFTPDLDTDRLVFRLWPNGPRSSQAGGALRTGEVTVDGKVVPASADDPTTLVVRPGGTLARGKTIEARVPWTLELPIAARDRVSRDGDAVRLGSFFPILPWEPGVGWNTDPAVGAFAEASTAPVADFDVNVTVPDGLGVLASGVPDRPGHWTANAMRDFALSIGRFTVASGTANAPNPVAVTVGVHEGIMESPERYLTKIVDVLEDFETRFGPYPWPSFSLAITPNAGGGIEYPSHVMQAPGTSGSITTHEVAHQWFYGLVGNNQGRDPWLDEGLASWGEARYERRVATFEEVPLSPAAAGHLGEPMTYWANQPDSYFEGVYIQGVQVLAALGPPDLVDCALRAYAAVYGNRIARQYDLLAALSTAFPNAASVLAGYGVRP